jgi:hypothetical protein
MFCLKKWLNIHIYNIFIQQNQKYKYKSNKRINSSKKTNKIISCREKKGGSVDRKEGLDLHESNLFDGLM